MTLNQRLFQPLHLTDTFYIPYAYSKTIMNRMAHGYGTTAQAGEVPPPEKVGNDITRFNLSMGGAAGAMISTAPDLVRWIQALFNNQVLPAKQLKEMLTPVCVGDDGTCKPGMSLPSGSHSNGYGLGIASFFYPIYGTCWTYLGSTPGYYADFLWIPKKNTALALTVSATTKKTMKIIPVLISVSKMIVD